MEVLTSPSNRTSNYIYDGYIYYKSRSRLDKIYLTCAVKSCWARGVYAGTTFRTTHDHNHPRQDHEISVKRLLHDLLAETIKSSKPLMSIFNDVCSQHSGVARYVTYDSVYSVMSRAKKRASEVKDMKHSNKIAKSADIADCAGAPNTSATQILESADTGNRKQSKSIESDKLSSTVSNQVPAVKRVCYRKLLPKTPNTSGLLVPHQYQVVKVAGSACNLHGQGMTISNTKASQIVGKVARRACRKLLPKEPDKSTLTVSNREANADNNNLDFNDKRKPGSAISHQYHLIKVPETSETPSSDVGHVGPGTNKKASQFYRLVKIPRNSLGAVPPNSTSKIYPLVKITEPTRIPQDAHGHDPTTPKLEASPIVATGNRIAYIQLDHNYADKPDFVSNPNQKIKISGITSLSPGWASATTNPLQMNRMIQISGSTSPPPLVPIGTASPSRNTSLTNRLNKIQGTAIIPSGVTCIGAAAQDSKSPKTSHIIKLSGADNVPACASCHNTTASNANTTQINLVMNFPGATSIKPVVEPVSDAKSPQIVNLVVNLPGTVGAPLGVNGLSTAANKANTPQLNHVIKIIEPAVSPLHVGQLNVAPITSAPQISRVIKISEVGDISTDGNHGAVVPKRKAPPISRVTKVSTARSAGLDAASLNENATRTCRCIVCSAAEGDPPIRL